MSDGLRLAALDEDDLRALSAAVQDAVAKVGDLVLDRRRHAFTAVLNRYRWEEERACQRVRSALRVETVSNVRARGLRADHPDAVVNLLAVEFEPRGEPPGGVLRFVLSGGGEIEADVECIDVALMDLSRPWRARARPEHGG